MQTRRPIVAGQFYPGRRADCINEIDEYLKEAALSDALPDEVVAGIVPHAGWTFSGQLAAMVFSAVKQHHEDVNTFVIFGAAHGYFGSPAVYDKGRWATPLGEAAIDEDLATAVLDSSTAISDSDAHSSEHSIEVQVPFIQHLFADAQILPIVVPPSREAVSLGEAVGSIVADDKDKKIVCIGSTDLTHYGPRYGFTPMGIGAQALRWASEVNDKKFIDLALKLDAVGLLASAVENLNACGGGAAAAAVAAAKKLGSESGVLLAHTNSNEVMMKKMGTSSTDAVGYAAIVF